MKVAKNVVVRIAYQVRTEDGVLVDEAPANQPLQYLQGHNNLVIGLENALEGKSVGDKFEVRVKPEEGYGEYNENMVQRVPKDVFVGVDDLAALLPPPIWDRCLWSLRKWVTMMLSSMVTIC